MLPRLLLALLLITVQSAGAVCGLHHATEHVAGASATEHDAAHADSQGSGEHCDVCDTLAGFATPPTAAARDAVPKLLERGASPARAPSVPPRADGAGLARAPPAFS